MSNLTIRKAEMEDALWLLLQQWLDHAVDDEYGGFYNVSCRYDYLRGGEKAATLNMRILWAFSEAFFIKQNKEYLQMADRAFDYISGHFVDREYGGIYPFLSCDGKPLCMQKQGYVHSYAIAAFSAYYKVTGKQESLWLARDIFDRVWKCSKNKYGVYAEECTREWQPSDNYTGRDEASGERSFSLRPNMHLLWSFEQLCAVDENAEVEQAIEKLVILMNDRMVNAELGAVYQHFGRDFKPVSDMESYGDNFEASWIMREALSYVRDKNKAAEIEKNCIKIVEHTMKSAVDLEYGGVYRDYKNNFICTDKEWWVQTEAVTGLLCAFQCTGKKHYMEQAEKCWDFIKERIAKPDGTWNWKTKRTGEPYNAREIRGPLMCPFHNGRMLMKAINYFNNKEAE